MLIPAERWHKALKIRSSHRSFSDREIPKETIRSLETICLDFRPFGDQAYGVLVTESPDAVFKGIIGSYGLIKGAKAYIAFIGEADAPNIDAKVGYTGEGLILEATYLDLATCWIGGFFKPEIVKEQVQLKSNQKIFAISPVGYSVEKKSLMERLMKTVVGAKKRKSLVEISQGIEIENWTEWQRTALEAARIAPSAVNRQPWKFTVAEDSLTLAIDEGKNKIQIAKELDCGIAMLHAEIGARVVGVEGEWELLDSPQVGQFILK